MFNVEFLEQAVEFLESIDKKAYNKILYNIKKATIKNDTEIFKKLQNTDIWEFRTLFNSIQYRLLAFWDKRNNSNTLVICCNGFIKKTQKTPKTEIEKAEKLMKQYFKNL